MGLKQKNNTPFLYDENNNLVGVKNENGTDQRLFAKIYNSGIAVSAVSAAATFVTLTAAAGASSTLTRISSAGIHSLTSASDGLGVYVTWDGTGSGVNGIYAMTYVSTTAIDIASKFLAKVVTIGVQSPGVFTCANHGFSLNDGIRLTTTGTLPTGLATGTTYYVNNVLDTSTFTVSATVGGAGVNVTAAGSGAHTATSYYGVPTVGLITTNIPVASFTVGAGEITRTGYMNLSAIFTLVSNANNKAITVQYGGVDWVNTGTLTASMLSVYISKVAYARTPTTLISSPVTSLGHGALNAANVVITKDYSAAQTLIIYVKSGTVNEAITLEGYELEVN
jgi:hypothetical protein